MAAAGTTHRNTAPGLIDIVHFEEDEAVGRSKSQKASSWLKLKL
jgi:hypothetical protein